MDDWVIFFVANVIILYFYLDARATPLYQYALFYEDYWATPFVFLRRLLG